ncbi:Cyclic di-GMP phosphodiesterase Gmr [Vibrio ruber DSM 16370]|uniref:Cyclic di-GMP phosphodiesterase Gmr n=1 Tax=Vibrio ruber (strain DSM 16370 / JCM 11486 / BCRC 17186 / CECT 7878 / LMG 23124 / VR1) TaxID=1123498 RepID=A0A1R4LAT8_VIBR1|nr:GGDEF domain-containing response regulator [Vibrio ruber]SJN53681.1 Cyclic di-GMP phosphodiesterase Gmr [Vibrio ruber DSM 16370]
MDILIIDDDAVDRMSAIRTLRQSELSLDKIDQADTATDGIRCAAENGYDIILLDYQIPPSNGIEILREIRGGNDYSTAIVMLSHSNDENLALSCIEAGAQDFVMKSEITASRLKRAILISQERHSLEQQVRESHERLRYIAERDSLTGLRNRYFFDEALRDAITKNSRSGEQLVLMLLDLDNFKKINDVLGHQAGDSLLQEIARRLENPIRKSDKLCRLGGDEFAILVYDLPQLEHVRLLADRILKSLEKPMIIQGQTVAVTASIGVATYPLCATDATGLMKCADVAMYRAKELGRNRVQYYSHDFHQKMVSRMQLEFDLKQAIQGDQLILFFQPQLDTHSEQLVGVEALIRWQHHDLGIIQPDEFIPIAEESDLIIDIGRWVIQAACRQFSQWVDAAQGTHIHFSIAVNLSARQLKDHALSEFLQNCLKQYNIPADLVELELTESHLENSLSAIEMLNSLSDTGVKLSLDDFGTGYSSLSHLSQFPFSILKIDKSFVQSSDDEKQRTLLRAICAFAHSLGYETVAEGIETEAQKSFCQSLNVNRLQGYLFSQPIPAQAFENIWLQGTI